MFKLTLLPDKLAICRLSPDAAIPRWALGSDFYSITRTADELSIVCHQTDIPDDVQSEGDWRCLKVHGPLAFSMVGVMASLTAPLAAAGISIFVISTFDTDYLLVKQAHLESAIAALSTAGHSIIRPV
ncbi:MAG: ACT domain-containing protein [Blastocatellia bacterium]